MADASATIKEKAGSGLLPRKLREVVEHVKHNLEHHLTVSELAGVAGLSEKYFQQKFKESTGKTPHRYVIEQRVEQARRLLEASELSVSAIASQCGFADVSHLSLQFRLLHGVTPCKYRRKTWN